MSAPTAELRICYLGERPEAVGVLAGWFAHEWGDGSDERTAHGYARQLAAAVDPRELPVCLVGLAGDEPVATATLKFREIEYAPEADYWLGWVCVPPEARGRGYGSALVAAVEAEAARRRLPELFLHTPTAETFYRALGWRRLERVVAEGGPSTVMTKAVARGSDDPRSWACSGVPLLRVAATPARGARRPGGPRQ